jgi:hypothetical protein
MMASTQVSRQPSEVDGSNVPALSGTVSLSSTLNSSLHAKGSAGGASSLASKIAAFSNGVAPVKSGMMADPDEDELLIEEVMHKLEAAARVRWLIVGTSFTYKKLCCDAPTTGLQVPVAACHEAMIYRNKPAQCCCCWGYAKGR